MRPQTLNEHPGVSHEANLFCHRDAIGMGTALLPCPDHCTTEDIFLPSCWNWATGQRLTPRIKRRSNEKRTDSSPQWGEHSAGREGALGFVTNPKAVFTLNAYWKNESKVLESFIRKLKGWAQESDAVIIWQEFVPCRYLQNTEILLHICYGYYEI